jgi:MFS family permease
MFGMFFLGARYMQRILGHDPFQVGLAFLPTSLVMGTMSFRYCARLSMRFGLRATLIPSLASIGVALLLFARTPVDGSYVTDILPAMILLGFGAGLGFPALMMLAMSGANPRDSGLASGLVNISAQVGGAIGLALLATLATERTDGLLADGQATASALNSGYHLAYLVGAALVAVAIVVVLSVLRAKTPHPRPGRAVAASSQTAADHRGDAFVLADCATDDGTQQARLACLCGLRSRAATCPLPCRRALGALRERGLRGARRRRIAALLAVGPNPFWPLGPLPFDGAFALTLIALSVLTFALCLLTLPFSGVLCALTIVVCSLALVFPLSFVLRVAVGTDR